MNHLFELVVPLPVEARDFPKRPDQHTSQAYLIDAEDSYPEGKAVEA